MTLTNTERAQAARSELRPLRAAHCSGHEREPDGPTAGYRGWVTKISISLARMEARLILRQRRLDFGIKFRIPSRIAAGRTAYDLDSTTNVHTATRKMGGARMIRSEAMPSMPADTLVLIRFLTATTIVKREAICLSRWLVVYRGGG